MVRLNAQGWNVPAIAKIFECHEHTVRAALRHWENLGWVDCGKLLGGEQSLNGIHQT
jgi:transposase